ncbi:two-component system response regulator [Actimicrobium sp. GrIS 1.19]|uniref:response regulator n=1 Tax=Actimicrobium sp. GrIS 1.19 TaxID=3071708 RepID=UPI002DF73302|nr:two-component system response regulator [Actimicrobium sp. GrIS 1.19]
MSNDEFQQVDILLVEDTATDAEMTIRALRRRGLANSLIWVKDGSEALDFLYRTGKFAGVTNGKPKLVLLDVKMPKVDGIEVLRRIRGDEVLRMIPVVMLTSSAEERDVVESYALGANSYIVKPVDTLEFDKVITETGLYWMLVNKVPL